VEQLLKDWAETIMKDVQVAAAMEML